MKPLIIVLIAAFGLLAAVTGIPRLHSVGRAGTGNALPLHDMQSGLTAHQLPADDFDDRSLVFPRESKH